MKAGEAASQMPKAIGETLSQVAAEASRVPGVVGDSVSGQLPQSIPALFDAQADVIRETAEATTSATRQRLTH